MIFLIVSPASTAKRLAPSKVCPTITAECVSDNDCCDSPFEFVAHVSGTRPTDKPTYKWSITFGTIISGQGTPSIKIDTTGFGGRMVTAQVEVDGLDPGCTNTAYVTQTICDYFLARVFDRYGNLAFRDEKARLANFAIQLQNEPGAQGYLIVYNNSLDRAKRAKKYLVNSEKIEAARIAIIEGGERQGVTVELWVVPAGATPPEANPPTPSNNSFNRSGNSSDVIVNLDAARQFFPPG